MRKLNFFAILPSIRFSEEAIQQWNDEIRQQQGPRAEGIRQIDLHRMEDELFGI